MDGRGAIISADSDDDGGGVSRMRTCALLLRYCRVSNAKRGFVSILHTGGDRESEYLFRVEGKLDFTSMYQHKSCCKN